MARGTAYGNLWGDCLDQVPACGASHGARRAQDSHGQNGLWKSRITNSTTGISFLRVLIMLLHVWGAGAIQGHFGPPSSAVEGVGQEVEPLVGDT